MEPWIDICPKVWSVAAIINKMNEKNVKRADKSTILAKLQNIDSCKKFDFELYKQRKMALLLLKSRTKYKNTNGIIIQAPKDFPEVPGGGKWILYIQDETEQSNRRAFSPEVLYLIAHAGVTRVSIAITKKNRLLSERIFLTEGYLKEGVNPIRPPPPKQIAQATDIPLVTTVFVAKKDKKEAEAVIEKYVEESVVDFPPEKKKALQKTFFLRPELLPPRVFLPLIKKIVAPDPPTLPPPLPPSTPPTPPPSPPTQRQEEEGAIRPTLPPALGVVPATWQKGALYTVYNERYYPTLRRIRDQRRSIVSTYEDHQNGLITDQELETAREEYDRVSAEFDSISMEMYLAWLSAYPVKASSMDRITARVSQSRTRRSDQQKLRATVSTLMYELTSEKGGVINGQGSLEGGMYRSGHYGFGAREYGAGAKQIMERMEMSGETPKLSSGEWIHYDYILSAEGQRTPLTVEKQNELRGQRTAYEGRNPYPWEQGLQWAPLYMADLQMKAFEKDAGKMRKRISQLGPPFRQYTKAQSQQMRQLSDYYLHEMQDERVRLTNNLTQQWLQRFPLPSMTQQESQQESGWDPERILSTRGFGTQRIEEKINNLADEIRHEETLRRRQIQQVYIDGGADAQVSRAIEESDRKLAAKIVKRNFLRSKYMSNGGDPTKIVDQQYLEAITTPPAVTSNNLPGVIPQVQ